MTTITQYQFEQECQSIAEDIREEYSDGQDFDEYAYERAHEWADGHQWVIYTYQAGQLAQLPNANNGEQWLEDVYGKPFDGCETYSEVVTRLAYATLLVGIQDALANLTEEEEV